MARLDWLQGCLVRFEGATELESDVARLRLVYFPVIIA